MPFKAIQISIFFCYFILWMACVTFSFASNALLAVSNGPKADLQSIKRRSSTHIRNKPPFKVIRAVQVSGAESQAASEIKGDGHMKKSNTLYEVLGLSRGASGQDIKTAYRKLARQFHPDTAASSEAKSMSTEMFLQIHNAYAILSKAEDRAQYDLQLVMQQRQRWNMACSGGAYRNPHGHVVGNWETDQCW